VIAALWCLTIIVTIGVIMFGIYMIVRVKVDMADELRQLKRRQAETLRDNEKLQGQIVDLKVEIERLKNRKVHDADTE
jgi:hypothetical protein